MRKEFKGGVGPAASPQQKHDDVGGLMGANTKQSLNDYLSKGGGGEIHTNPITHMIQGEERGWER